MVLLLAARVAHAGHAVVVLSDERAFGPALQIALAGRDVTVATAAAPAGELRLERAAAAQRFALEIGADAALWVDTDGGPSEVCSVSADGHAFRHTPLPADAQGSAARAFAATAAGLIDDLAPPPAPVAVHVDATVAAPPGLIVAAPRPLAPEEPRRWVSIGGSVSFASLDSVQGNGAAGSYTARAEVDAFARGSWLFGIAIARGSDERFTEAYDMWGGVGMTDTRFVAYAANAIRRGRFELRCALGAGLLATLPHRWWDQGDMDLPRVYSPIVEASSTVSIDLFDRAAFAVGPVVSVFNQTFPALDASTPAINRGIDFAVFGLMKWAP